MVDSRTKLESSLQVYFIFQVKKEVPYLQNLRIFLIKQDMWTYSKYLYVISLWEDDIVFFENI